MGYEQKNVESITISYAAIGYSIFQLAHRSRISRTPRREKAERKDKVTLYKRSTMMILQTCIILSLFWGLNVECCMAFSFVEVPRMSIIKRSTSSVLPAVTDDDVDDSDFYRDLQKAKNQKLGSPIPEEQLKESAQDAEQEFMRAMKQTKKEFQDAKEELGSTGAVEFFLERIREEDEQAQQEENIE